MHALAQIIRDLLIFTAVCFALLVVLIVAVSLLPAGHPLKRLMTELCWRVGVTFGLGALAVPLAPIPGLDALYDVASPIVLLIYWFTFFRHAYRAAHPPPLAPRR